MIALLTLSLASAEQTTADGLILSETMETTDVEHALIETAAHCCMVAPPTLALQSIPITRKNFLRLHVGHTRRGAIDYLGGTALSDQLIAFDSVPMMFDKKLSPAYRPTGTMVLPHNTRLVPRPSAIQYW